ncbi:unnamed protein product [Calicophoron daubneyi]|uniref:Antimicrobial peptide n=1 Tax=Calicophoron daubneyi TaxID=300641 RepID=A0AAV2T5Y3_CALDB
MKFVVLICLVAVLFTAYAEARPDEATRARLRESGTKLWKAVGEACEKIRAKIRAKVDAYFEKDGLGEKLAEIVEILMKRLQARIEKATEKIE